VIRTSGKNEGRATRLDYFDDAAAQRIQQVQPLKKQEVGMARIAESLFVTDTYYSISNAD